MPENKDHSGSIVSGKLIWPAGYIRRVVVKFLDTKGASEIPYDERFEAYPERYLGRNWSLLLKRFPGITIQRLITSVTPQQIRELTTRAWNRSRANNSVPLNPVPRSRERDDNKPPNFLTYFSVSCPAGVEAQAVADALRKWRPSKVTGQNPKAQPRAALNQRAIEVELAYVESGPTPSPVIILSPEEDPQQQGAQNYLLPAPDGIDAKYAWTIAGGDGDTGHGAAGLQFVDIEQGWTIAAVTLNSVLTDDHEDLPAGIQCIWGVPRRAFGHGTGVLGIVLAVPGNADGTVPYNNPGSKNCVGITPKVMTPMVASVWPSLSSTSMDRVNAIWAATWRLNPGDVLLLEDQIYAHGSYGGHTGFALCPLEVEDALNDAIWTATHNDRIVIEAAGNGGMDLDNFTPDGSFRENNIVYSRGSTYWKNKRDTGAIMVASADGATRDPSLVSTNSGSRIDCFAWGNGISTLGNPNPDPPPPSPPNLPGPQDYIPGFSGTSGASAIVAGAALAIQGISQVFQKGDLTSTGRFSPKRLRGILGDRTTGTKSNDPSNDKIGVMPNLRKIIDETLKLLEIPHSPRSNEKPQVFVTIGRRGGPGPRKPISRKHPVKAKRNPSK